MNLQAIRLATMEGHERGVGKLVSAFFENVEDFVFAGRITAIGFENEGERGQPIAAVVGVRDI